MEAGEEGYGIRGFGGGMSVDPGLLLPAWIFAFTLTVCICVLKHSGYLFFILQFDFPKRTWCSGVCRVLPNIFDSFRGDTLRD